MLIRLSVLLSFAYFLIIASLCLFEQGDAVHARCQYFRNPSFRAADRTPSVRKCCCHGEALESGEGCVNYTPPSEYIAQINSSYSVGVGFPDIRPRECNMTMVRDKWFISERGSLVVKAEQGDLAIVNYCIDDLLIRNKPSPRAVTCTHELKRGALPLTAFRTRTIGKCCARDEHFSFDSMECVKGAHSNMDASIPGAPNNTQLGFTGIPECNEGEQISLFFEENKSKHVRLARNLSLIVITMDGHCIKEEKLIKLGDYCLDYSWNDKKNTTSQAVALMCLPKTQPIPTPMKSALLTFLLSMSCIALILTIVFLVALQAKGILSHVPQVSLCRDDPVFILYYIEAIVF